MKLPTATLYGTVPGSMKFVYKLSKKYHHFCGVDHDASDVHIFTRPGFTKVSCGFGQELIKTLGVKSHAEVLKSLGYEWRLSTETLWMCTDDEILDFLEAFEKSGDDTSDVWKAYERR